MARFSDWLHRKWSKLVKEEDAQAIYLKHLETVFNSEPGKYILQVWITENYAVMSKFTGQSDSDVAYNEGRRSFIHELLQDLDNIESPHRPEVEVETDG